METRANYVAVGIFTLALVLAAFGFVYWTSGVGSGGDFAQLRVRIPGSASGLGRGSAVLFNGVKVGEVTRIFIDVNDPNVALADTRIDRLTPITRSTTADVGIAGLTGQASIELKGGAIGEANLLTEAEAADTVAEIQANPSALGNILQLAQNFLTRADNVLTTFEGFVTDVRGPLTATVQNAQKFSEALGSNADQIDSFLANVGKLSETVASVSGKLETTLDAAEGLLNAVDRDKVQTIVGNVETFTDRLKTASDQIDGIMTQVDTALTSVNKMTAEAGTAISTLSRDASTAIGRISDGATGTLERVDGTLAKVDGIVSAVKPEDVQVALTNIRQTSETARRAADDVLALTNRVNARTNDIDRIITDASQLASRLNAASVRVDGVLAKLDTLLGSDNAEGLMADASATLKSFRQVADTLNARIGTITDGLARFSGQGLRDAESLIQDARRSITRIESAISDLSRNPQRILTGGEGGTVRQYDGRARR